MFETAFLIDSSLLSTVSCFEKKKKKNERERVVVDIQSALNES